MTVIIPVGGCCCDDDDTSFDGGDIIDTPCCDLGLPQRIHVTVDADCIEPGPYVFEWDTSTIPHAWRGDICYICMDPPLEPVLYCRGMEFYCECVFNPVTLVDDCFWYFCDTDDSVCCYFGGPGSCSAIRASGSEIPEENHPCLPLDFEHEFFCGPVDPLPRCSGIANITVSL